VAKGGLTSRILTPERKLSLQVFFSNKLAVVGLVIVLAYVADALIVQFAPWLIGLKHPFEGYLTTATQCPSPPRGGTPSGQRIRALTC